MTGGNISLKTLLSRFWKKALVTWVLVILEGLGLLLMPLVIGWSVDDLIKGQMHGIIPLAGLCLVLLAIGAGRRFYDTRIYSGIFRKVSSELVTRGKLCETSVSKISARTNLFTEFIKFLEHSIPDLFNHFIGLVGALAIIFFINIQVFWTCLAGAAVISIIYALSQNKIHRLNMGQNNEFEKQVDIIASQDSTGVKTHFKNLMVWTIRLSDLETINFSLTWLILTAVLIASILVAATLAETSFGQVVSIIMYVFGFIESVMTFPLHYQQIIRLQEIGTRLANPQNL